MSSAALAFDRQNRVSSKSSRLRPAQRGKALIAISSPPPPAEPALHRMFLGICWSEACIFNAQPSYLMHKAGTSYDLARPSFVVADVVGPSLFASRRAYWPAGHNLDVPG